MITSHDYRSSNFRLAQPKPGMNRWLVFALGFVAGGLVIGVGGLFLLSAMFSHAINF